KSRYFSCHGGIGSQKCIGSFVAKSSPPDMKISGCWPRYSASDVLPDLAAPTTKKFGCGTRDRASASARGVTSSVTRLIPAHLSDTLRRTPRRVASQAAGPHVGPDTLDVIEALLLRTALAGVVPSRRVLTIRRPDRVLLLVVD